MRNSIGTIYDFGFTNKKVEGLYYPCSKNKAVVRAGSLFFVLVFTLKMVFHEMAHIIKCINKMLFCVVAFSLQNLKQNHCRKTDCSRSNKSEPDLIAF